MGAVNVNSISLAAIRESNIGQLPSSGEAEYLEPNEISTFGAEITTVARQPISKYRMQKKGTVTDISSTVEFEQDTTASLLLQMLAGGIYSRWIKRPYNVRRNVSVLGVGKNTVPNYRGQYAGIDAALAAITNPVAGNWWNNTIDKKEWVYDGTSKPNPHYRGQFASETAAIVGIKQPVIGDWFNNNTDKLEWDFVNTQEPDPNYAGQFANVSGANAGIVDPQPGIWWDNLSDGHEWTYDGTETTASGYRGSFATVAALTAAIKDPAVGDWANVTADSHEYDCTSVQDAAGYRGNYLDEATAIANIENPVSGDWFNNDQTGTEWNYVPPVPADESAGTAEVPGYWQNTGNPTTTRPIIVGVWGDTGNPTGTRDVVETMLWKDTGKAIGTTSKTIAVLWKASERPMNSTPTTVVNWWKASSKAAFTTATETILSDGGFNMIKPLDGSLVAGTLLYARGFTNPENNGLKVVKGGTKSLSYVTDTGLIAEAGNDDASVFVCGFQASTGDLRIDKDGNLVSTLLNFQSLGIEEHSGIFIGGLAPATRFAQEQDYGLCRVVKVEPHRITLDKRPNAFIADNGTGKTIHIYNGWFIQDVAVDSNLFTEQSFSFELAYPGVNENGSDGYEYAVGHLINTLELSLPLSDKSVTTISTFGLDVQPITANRQNWTRQRPLFQEAFSTPNDFIRLRLEKEDGYGLSTLFKECTLTLNNNAGGEAVLGKLGPAFTNYGNFDVTLSFQCVFTNPEVSKMIRNNCTVTLDFCLINNDGGFYFDIPSMTLGGGDKDFTTNEKVKVNLTSSAFGDPYPGYTIGVTYFPYLPNPKADACA